MGNYSQLGKNSREMTVIHCIKDQMQGQFYIQSTSFPLPLMMFSKRILVIIVMLLFLIC